VSSVAGRLPRKGSGVYNLTKFGVGAFTESLRQEVTGRHVRVSLLEPGWVNTELPTHVRTDVQEQALQRFHAVEEMLEAEDIADVIQYIVTRRRRVAIGELLVRSTSDV
jgi:NADP-dependent 3-hydroxy acid dehydrogenase YdfG